MRILLKIIIALQSEIHKWTRTFSAGYTTGLETGTCFYYSSITVPISEQFFLHLTYKYWYTLGIPQTNTALYSSIGGGGGGGGSVVKI
jgi:hypothetical protein